MTEDLIKLVLLLLGSCVIYFGALGLIELIRDITHPDDDGDKRND